MGKPEISLLHQRFTYDPETGILRYRLGRRAGKPAERRSKDGYLVVSLLPWRCLNASHIIWAMMKGWWPANQIDHINRVVTDNRICNLREATISENARNKGVSKLSRSGIKGVWYRDTPRGPRKPPGWYAQLEVHGKKWRRGPYQTVSRAMEAYADLSRNHHGEFGSVE